jgi:hypothetical protein
MNTQQATIAVRADDAPVLLVNLDVVGKLLPAT